MKNPGLLWALFAIGLLSLLMKVLMGEVLVIIPHRSGITEPFFVYAHNLIHNHVFSQTLSATPPPDSFRPPLYPLFLAAVQLVSGIHQWDAWVATIQYLMGAATSVFIAILGIQLAGRRVGLIAGVLSAFYLDLIYISIPFLREGLALFFLLPTFICFVEFLKTGRARWIVSTAVLYSLGLFSRPEITIVGAMLIFFFWGPLRRHFGGRKTLLIVSLALAFGPCALWAARNTRVQGHFVPFSTEGAWAFYMGQIDHPDVAYTTSDQKALDMVAVAPSEYHWYRQMMDEGLDAVIRHPLRNLWWAWLKVRLTFQEFAVHKLGLMFPVLWIVVPWVALRGRRYRWWAVGGGAALSLFQVLISQWDREAPIYLFHTSFSEIVVLAAVGFPLMMFKGEKDNWKVLAAPFLTLVLCTGLLVHHLRQRVVLCDWMLVIAAAFCISQAIDFIERKTAGKEQG